MTSVSGYVKHYILKICQIVAGISMIRQFHEFLKSHFRCVFYKFLQIQIASVSGHVKHYIFKIRQIVAGTNMTRQFHEFFKSHFWLPFPVMSSTTLHIQNLSKV